jgi:tetraacyldisaccharide 4'-kinase
VLDDGLQNPTLVKDVSFLVIDGVVGFGNGRVLPAGPLRESIAAAVARSQAAVLIGPDLRGAARRLPPGLPVLRASLAPDSPALTGQRVLAFAGIGRPDKFFNLLEETGARLVARRAFPDHHPFTPGELRTLFATASRLGAIPVTTAKDAARLPPAQRARVRVFGVRLVWEDEAALDRVLDA